MKKLVIAAFKKVIKKPETPKYPRSTRWILQHYGLVDYSAKLAHYFAGVKTFYQLLFLVSRFKILKYGD